MSFRALNQRWLLPLSQIVMILGIVALCQPWSEVFHRYGLTLTLFGLVAFMVTVHISPDKEVDPDDLNPFDAVDMPRLNPDRPEHRDPGDARTIV